MIFKIKQLLQPYVGQLHKQGINDCNYLFLLLHEPEIAEKLHGRYTTIVGGCRVAKKEVGYSSIRQFVEESGKYIEVHPQKYSSGDALVFDDSHEVAIVSGKNFYGFCDDVYRVQPISALAQKYKVFRKVHPSE